MLPRYLSRMHRTQGVGRRRCNRRAGRGRSTSRPPRPQDGATARDTQRPPRPNSRGAYRTRHDNHRKVPAARNPRKQSPRPTRTKHGRATDTAAHKQHRATRPKAAAHRQRGNTGRCTRTMGAPRPRHAKPPGQRPQADAGARPALPGPARQEAPPGPASHIKNAAATAKTAVWEAFLSKVLEASDPSGLLVQASLKIHQTVSSNVAAPVWLGGPSRTGGWSGSRLGAGGSARFTIRRIIFIAAVVLYI